MKHKKFAAALLAAMLLMLTFAPAGASAAVKKSWVKSFGGAEQDRFKSIAQVGSQYIAVGYTNSLGTGDVSGYTSRGNSDAMLVVYDKNGKRVGRKVVTTYEDDSFEDVVALDKGYVVLLKSGLTHTARIYSAKHKLLKKVDLNYRIAYSTDDPSIGKTKYGFVYCNGVNVEGFDKNGKSLWSRHVNVSDYYRGMKYLCCYGNNVYMAEGNRLIALNAKTGKTVRTQRIKSVDYLDAGYIDGGEIVLSGVKYAEYEGGQSYLIKLKSNCKLVWKKKYDSEIIWDATITKQSGEYIVAGQVVAGDWYSCIISEVSANGKKAKTTCLKSGGYDEGIFSALPVSGGIVAVGSFNSEKYEYGDNNENWTGLKSKGDIDAFIARFKIS